MIFTEISCGKPNVMDSIFFLANSPFIALKTFLIMFTCSLLNSAPTVKPLILIVSLTETTMFRPISRKSFPHLGHILSVGLTSALQLWQ